MSPRFSPAAAFLALCAIAAGVTACSSGPVLKDGPLPELGDTPAPGTAAPLPTVAWEKHLPGPPGLMALSDDGLRLYVALAGGMGGGSDASHPRLCRVDTPSGDGPACVDLEAPARALEALGTSGGGAVGWLRDGTLRAWSADLKPLWNVKRDCVPRSLGGDPTVVACFRADTGAATPNGATDSSVGNAGTAPRASGRPMPAGGPPDVELIRLADGASAGTYQFSAGSLSAWDASPASGAILAGSSDGTVVLLDRKLRVEWSHKVDGAVTAAALTPDRAAVVAVSGIRSKVPGPRLVAFDHGGRESSGLALPRHVASLRLESGGQWAALFGAGPSGQWLGVAKLGKRPSLSYERELRRFAEFSPPPEVLGGDSWMAGLDLDPQGYVAAALSPEGRVLWYLSLPEGVEGYLLRARPGSSDKGPAPWRVYLALEDGRLQAWQVPVSAK